MNNKNNNSKCSKNKKAKAKIFFIFRLEKMFFG
jgi:hypothetical protein